jgi:hypothetical protein
MLDFAEKNMIPNIDISASRHVPGNTKLPEVWHPSAIAHEKYTNKMERFLRSEILEYTNPFVRN